MIRTPAQIINDFKKGKKGFTLIEVILASSLFTVVSLIGVMIFTDVVRVQRKIYLESALYEDGRFLMERIAREIRQNTIDYEEYYNRSVLVNEGGGTAFGKYFGCYATRFYNPGTTSIGTRDVIGATCSAPAADKGFSPTVRPGCVIDKRTLDINTGRNPYMAIDAFATASKANAFCDQQYYPGPSCVPTSASLMRRDQLYLIDAKGAQKTILALKKVTDLGGGKYENALSMIRLNGEDSNKDGLTETWWDPAIPPTKLYCDEPAFDCAPANFAPSYKLEESLNAVGSEPKLWQGFVPISPLRSTVKSLSFYVSPMEDPRKAFAETDPALGMQQQPHVTIILTLEPAAGQLTNYGGTPPYLTLQTTVSSRVYNEVRSYTGQAVCPSYL